ncbi:MAG: pyridoxal-phosphate dependent enzyme, partial [Armatimonadota bacterium]
ENPANPAAHEQTTGPEIWEATGGQVDAFVAGVGTGGTVTGVGRYLKSQDAEVTLIAVEPAESAVISGEKPGSHGIQGIGAGFIPPVLDTELLDDVRTISRPSAVATARELATKEGIISGISSGANVKIARDVAAELGPGHTVVTVICDTGERYLSTDLFDIDEL